MGYILREKYQSLKIRLHRATEDTGYRYTRVASTRVSLDRHVLVYSDDPIPARAQRSIVSFFRLDFTLDCLYHFDILTNFSYPNSRLLINREEDRFHYFTSPKIKIFSHVALLPLLSFSVIFVLYRFNCFWMIDDYRRECVRYFQRNTLKNGRVLKIRGCFDIVQFRSRRRDRK